MFAGSWAESWFTLPMCGDRSACVFCSNSSFFSDNVSHIWMNRTQLDHVALRTELLLTQGQTFLILFYFSRTDIIRSQHEAKSCHWFTAFPVSSSSRLYLFLMEVLSHTRTSSFEVPTLKLFQSTCQSFCPHPFSHLSPFLKPPEKWCSEGLHRKQGRSCRQRFHLLWCAQ